MAGCELCEARPLTRRYHEDDELWIADCLTCGMPMVVLREHRARPTPEQDRRMVEALAAVADEVLGEYAWRLDRRGRTIPGHAHLHARLKGRRITRPAGDVHHGWPFREDWDDKPPVREVLGRDCPVLYHGTSADRAERILREGLKVSMPTGRIGYRVDDFERAKSDHNALSTSDHVALTDDLAMARHYAEFRVASEYSLDPENASRKAAVVRVRLPATRKLMRGPSGLQRPVPWMTTVSHHVDEFVTDRSIAARYIGLEGEWEIPQLDEPAIRAFERDQLRFSAVFTLTQGTDQIRGQLEEAIPNARLLLDSQRALNPAFDERRALAVAAAGVRLIEAGFPVSGQPLDMGGTPEADPAVVFAFALLHVDPDCPDAIQAADVARELAGAWLTFDARQRELLTVAFVGHGFGAAVGDPTVGACWDAHALATGAPASKMRTGHGRALAATPELIPQPAETDWPWVYVKFGILAGPLDDAHALVLARHALEYADRLDEARPRRSGRARCRGAWRTLGRIDAPRGAGHRRRPARVRRNGGARRSRRGRRSRDTEPHRG